MKEDTTNFAIVRRWSFPQSTGGVAMHNHYLLNALEKKFKCNSISAESEINSGFNKNNGVVILGFQLQDIITYRNS